MGRRLAKFAVVVRVCEIALCERVGDFCGDFGVSLSWSSLEIELAVVVVAASCLVDVVAVRALRDIINLGNLQDYDFCFLWG